MPEVNLLHDTQSPEDPTKKPVRPKQEFEVSDPDADHGMGRFFKSILSRPKTAAAPEPSRMGLGKSAGDQRILKETRSAKPALTALPEENDTGIGVNLLSEDILNRQKPREQLIRLGLIALGAVFFVGLVYGGLILAQRSVSTQIEATRAELLSVETQIRAQSSKQETIQATVQKITAIKGLVERHIRWTRFFRLIEKHTLPSVTYGSQFAGDINGSLTFSAKTTSYEEMAKQYLVYQQAVDQKELLASFSITGASRGQSDSGDSQVTFAVTMSILPSAFANTDAQLSGETSLAPDLSDAQSLSGLAIFSTYMAGMCHIQAQPADLSLIPSQVQDEYQAGLAVLDATDCNAFTSTEREQARLLLNTDNDGDGLNALLESLFNTSDERSDTDNDGQTDLVQFVAAVNQTT